MSVLRTDCHSMTLGHVYDLDLKKNETPIREVIVQAQGEVGDIDAPLTPPNNVFLRWPLKSISNK